MTTGLWGAHMPDSAPIGTIAKDAQIRSLRADTAATMDQTGLTTHRIQMR